MLFLALKVGNLSAGNFAETYQVTAKFANIGGLKSGRRSKAPASSSGGWSISASTRRRTKLR